MYAKLFVLCAVVAVVAGHGYLKEPLARTSIHRSDVYNPVYNPPYWWDDTGVWCGNVPQDTRYSTCGRCGDAPGGNGANRGGEFDKGVITGQYQSGATITITADLTAAHGGHFEVELCQSDNSESDGCFQKLPIVAASEEIRDGNRVCVPYQNNAPSNGITANVRLPAGFRCTRCTLRWTYRTSYPPHSGGDYCDNSQPTQTFRNCADIRIQ